MTGKNFTTLLGSCTIALACSVNAHAALEAFTFTENFESVPVGDTLPTGWTEQPNTDYVVTNTLFTTSQVIQHMGETVTGASVLPYLGQSDQGHDSTDWLDFNVSAELGTGSWSDTTGLWWGIGARAQANGEFYGVRVRGSSSGAYVQLIRHTEVGGIEWLETSSTTSTIDSGETVLIDFSVANDDVNQVVNLSATMETNGGFAGGVTKTVSTSIPYGDVDAIEQPGPLMLITSDNATGGRQFNWDDIVVTGNAVVEDVVITGDLNLDGFVGIEDLNLVLSNWNQSPPTDPEADPSNDGIVGIEDLNVVLGNWNDGTPPAPSVVPEPATLALMGLGAVTALRRRR